MVTYFWILLIIGSGGVLLSIFILLFNFWRKALKYIFFSSLFLLCLLLGHLFVRSPEGFIIWQIDTEKWYQFASIFGAFLLVATLLFQIRSFRRQQVEAKFFEMIRYYRDNINEMEFENPYSKRDPPSVLKGRKVIVTIVKQFFLARNIIESLVDQNNWTYEDLINIGANTSYKKDKSILILELAYQFVFWGVSSENEDDCKSNLKAVYKSVIVDDIFNHLKSFPVFYSKLYKEKSVSCSIDFLRKSKLSGTNLAYCLAEMKLKSDSFNKSHVGFNKFFGGHQYHLGHYFRHLFQAVKFIDKQPSWLMSQDDKYEYLKTLRAQMSNYEQALLFINSLTQLGRKWEFDSIGKNFISNYHLIKNLPVNFIPNIKLQDYYPKVNFEWSVDITKTNTGMKMNFCEKIGNWTKGLSFWNLIYKKYKPEWLIITGFTFLLSIVSIAYPTYPGNINNNWWMLLCTLPITYLSVKYSWLRTREVIREHYPYVYEENIKWNHVTIRNIRKKILADRIGDRKSNPDFLKFILSAVDRRKNSKNYSYPLIISTISTLSGVYLGFALKGLDDIIKTESDFNQALIFLGGAIVIGILIAVFLEIFIVRDFVLNFRNRKNKVIECLEDILEELEFDKK